MDPIRILVLVDSSDPIATTFRNEIAGVSSLAPQVELLFAAPDKAQDVVQDIQVAVCGVLAPELIDRAKKLEWIAYWSAGLDGKVTPQLLDRKLLLTNASGVHGPNIAEHVMAFMLMFTRRMEIHLRSQINHVWERRMPVERPPAAELCGQTLGIVGLGRIGEALALRAKAFGMRVIGVKRNPNERYASGSSADEVLGLEELPHLLRESDHVCIALPYTVETRHLFTAATIALMKPTAYLYNIARGAIIEETALIAALGEGAIAGAGLDVFEEEPLPQSSELWGMQNVIITPHVAGLTPHYFDRFAKLFAENLQRYVLGDLLSNLYVSERGY